MTGQCPTGATAANPRVSCCAGILSASGSERATTVLSRTAWYSFQEQPGIRFKSSLVSGSLRSFRHDGWGRRATTPDVATARRRRAADCARREGLPTVDRPFAPYAPPLAYGTSGLHGRCDGPHFMRARACTPCPRCCGMRRGARWAPLSLISSLAGRRVASGRGARRPATASLQSCGRSARELPVRAHQLRERARMGRMLLSVGSARAEPRQRVLGVAGITDTTRTGTKRAPPAPPCPTQCRVVVRVMFLVPPGAVNRAGRR